MRIRELEVELKTAYEGAEQLRVQLAGVATAARGAIGPEHLALSGDYGWSPAYQDVVDLRRKYEATMNVAAYWKQQAARYRDSKAALPTVNELGPAERGEARSR